MVDPTFHGDDRDPAALWSGSQWIYAHVTTDPATALEWVKCGGYLVVRSQYNFGETILSGRHYIGKDGRCMDCEGPTDGPCFRKGWKAWAGLTRSEAKAMEGGE